MVTSDELSLRVPGNILLFGEYFVTEPGGRGLALACLPRARCRFTPGRQDQLTLIGRFGGEEVQWRLGDDPETAPPLFARSYERYRDELEAIPGGTLVVDTADFYLTGGRKLGWGSSAAAAVAITAMIRRLSSREGELHSAAVELHREIQGGRGSGYDVMVSAVGGLVLFRGGSSPGVRKASSAWLPPLYAFSGSEPVPTPGAVDRFRAWKSEEPHRAAELRGRSDELVGALAEAQSWTEAKPYVLELRRIGVEVGRRIGVSAEIRSPAAPSAEPSGGGESVGIGESPAKAVGAGNELGVLFAAGGAPPAETPAGLTPIQPDEEGLRWE